MSLRISAYLILISLLLLVLYSCKESKSEIDRLAIAKEYYRILKNSKIKEVASLLKDSLVYKSGDYVQVFSMAQYQDWMAWDSVFKPSYTLLDIKESESGIHSTVSKRDLRLDFLLGEPTVYEQMLHFDKDKIVMVEDVRNIDFNDTLFVRNREALLSWMDKHYPEKNDFIFDQTKSGAVKYLKAISLYNNRGDKVEKR